MQTFLPFSNFKKSAQCLDYKRLGKQRVEAWQLIDTIIKKQNNITTIIKNGKERKIGWLNHPALILWENNLEALKLYYNTVVQEWIDRKYNNNMKFFEINENKIILPSWLGNDLIHSSHRANLLRKDFIFYNKYCWKESPSDYYVWQDNLGRLYKQEKGNKNKIYL